jgi:hypothetical protein
MISVALLAVCAAAADPSVTLNNGVKMPLVAIGTWQYNDSTAEQAIKLALPLGFTHIDTAESYKNQVGVGKAIAGVDRKSYFVSQLDSKDHHIPKIIPVPPSPQAHYQDLPLQSNWRQP